jgi:acyl carrier protein
MHRRLRMVTGKAVEFVLLLSLLVGADSPWLASPTLATVARAAPRINLSDNSNETARASALAVRTHIAKDGPLLLSVTPTGGVVPTQTDTPAPNNGQPPTAAYFAEGYTGVASTNQAATFNEVLTMFNPNGAPAPATINYYVQGSETPQVVSRTIGAHATMREVVNTDVGMDRVVAAAILSPQHLDVLRTITRTASSGSQLDGSASLPVAAPSTSFSFAEGYTGATFQEYLAILNPGDVLANVSVVMAPQAASSAGAKTLTLTVPPFSRSTANIRALNQGGSAQSVGMLIGSDQPIVAERVLYFGDGSGSGKFGSTVTAPLTARSIQLRIGYGSSGGAAQDTEGALQPQGDQGFVTLVNPATSGPAAQVTVGFTDANGMALGQPVALSVPPGTRQTVDANVAIGVTPAGPYSATIRSTNVPIQAELAQYFGGSPNIGTHPGVALAALADPAMDVTLADLSTVLVDNTPIDRLVYLYNPNAAPEQVVATYFAAAPWAGTSPATYSVPGGGVLSVDVNQLFDEQAYRQDVEGKLRAIIAEQLGVDEAKVTRNASFQDDLHANPLDVVQLLISLEEEFKLQIPREDSADFKTVGNVLNYIIGYGLGPVSGEFKIVGSGSIFAYAVGRTPGGLSALEEEGVPVP